MPIKIDEVLRHEIYLNRLASNGVNTIIYPSLEAAYRAIRRELLDATINTPTQLKRLERAIRKAIQENDGWASITKELEALAVYEGEYVADYTKKAADVKVKPPTASASISAATTAFMVLESTRTSAGLWDDFIRSNLDSRFEAVAGIVRQGYSRGSTISQIGNGIRGLFEGMIKREAETLARTGYNHYATEARKAFADANADVIQHVEYVATLDNRTTVGCAALDGKRWPVGSPDIVQTPRHFNCRSTLLYLPDNAEVEGTRAAVGGQSGEDAKEAYEGRKDRLRTASQVRYRGKKDSDVFKAGQVKASTNYDQWLKSQPDWFVEDTLGKTKAQLYLKGDLPLNRFTDMTGNELTLDELRQRDAEAFRRAGL